jgi:hypothetical protein
MHVPCLICLAGQGKGDLLIDAAAGITFFRALVPPWGGVLEGHGQWLFDHATPDGGLALPHSHFESVSWMQHGGVL